MIDLEEEHCNKKSQYLAAKMGMIFLCDNCREEVYLPERKPNLIYNAAMPKWVHRNGGGSYDRRACYNDDSDGTACPMNEYELADYYDEIMEDDLWFNNDEA